MRDPTADDKAAFERALLEEWPDALLRPHPVKPLMYFHNCTQARWEGWMLAMTSMDDMFGVEDD